MSEILAPQGYESAESLQGTDIQEVYQPTSDGIRRNKQENLETLKTYYQEIDGYEANNLVESNSVGKPRTSTLSTSDVTTAISQVSTNTNDITDLEGRVGQSLNIADDVTFKTVNTGQGANELYEMNQNVKTTDNPTFASVNTGQGAVECYAMNQPVRTTDSPTFADVNITGLTGTVENNIETNASNISTNASGISTNASGISNNASGISSNAGNISTNANNIASNASDIATLESKVGQTLNTNSNVTFNSVTTDNVAIKHKLYTGTASSFTHGLDWNKIVSVSGLVYDSGDLRWVNVITSASSTSIIFEGGGGTYRALVTYQA